MNDLDLIPFHPPPDKSHDHNTALEATITMYYSFVTIDTAMCASAANFAPHIYHNAPTPVLVTVRHIPSVILYGRS